MWDFAWSSVGYSLELRIHSTEKGWASGPSFCLFHILYLELLLI